MFEMQRGVRQGCPISPLLFLLGVEMLANNIRQEQSIKGLNIDGNTHLIKQYADDTYFLLRDTKELKRILNKVNEFWKFSGLKMNEKKSWLLEIGLHQEFQDRTIAGIKVLQNGTILGIVFSKTCSAMENSSNWVERIERVKGILRSWEKRNLSIIGKFNIIKTFTISQFVYLFQSIFIHGKVLTELNTLFSDLYGKRKTIIKKLLKK